MIKLSDITIILLFILSSCGYAFSQEDSIDVRRYIMRSTMVGAGRANVFDTYLSPLEYKGAELRFIHENMRMTNLLGGNVSKQRIVQVNLAYTDNISQTANTCAGMINWTYALHYQFRVSPNFKLLVGPMIDLNGGFVYNMRNSNNPAQAKVYGSMDASVMAIYKLKIKNYPLVARYQANIPMLGLMFSPEYGQSYYEIFSLGHNGRNVLFTSLHNAPSFRQMLTVDFPVGNTTLRTGYLCDIQQSKVNNLKSHHYSHNFLLGFVRNFYLLKGRSFTDFRRDSNPFM